MKRPVVITLLIVALVFVLTGIGAVIFFTANHSGSFFSGGIQPFATAEESKAIKVDAESPVTLKVIDDAGSVNIVGADVKTVQVKVVKIVHGSTQARADDELKNVKYTVEQVGNNIILKYKLPNTTSFDINLDTIDFIVTVPNETTVDVETNLGEVTVTGIKGNAVIINDFGDVNVANIEGGVSVSNNSGDVTAASIKSGAENIELNSDFGAVTLKDASGNDITLDSNSGSITLSEVRAASEINARTDFGNITFENGSANSLSAESNSGAVSLAKVKVSKEINVQSDFGEIELILASATSYDLHTNSGSITVDGAKNTLKAYTDFGNIEITNAQVITLDLKTNGGAIQFSGSLGNGPHFVKSDFGEVSLTLPADTKLNVDLKTDFGGISSDIPLTVTLDGSSDKNHQVGTINGGGDQLTVSTNGGSISIKTLNP